MALYNTCEKYEACDDLKTKATIPVSTIELKIISRKNWSITVEYEKNNRQ